MLVEFTEFIRKDVRIRDKVKVLLAVPFLHSNNVEAESVFACDFMTLGEMVNLLVLI